MVSVGALAPCSSVASSLLNELSKGERGVAPVATYFDVPGGFDVAGKRVRMYSAVLSGLSRTLPGPLRT